MTYPDGRSYTKDHEWIEIAGDRGRIGITDFAQQQLGDVVYVDLPEVGSKLKAGQSFGTIESVKAVSELYAPVTGEVVEVDSTEDLAFSVRVAWSRRASRMRAWCAARSIGWVAADAGRPLWDVLGDLRRAGLVAGR